MDGGGAADHDARVAGIVEQVKADLRLRPAEDSERTLRDRLGDAGIVLSDDELTRLNQEIQGGDGPAAAPPAWDAR